MERREVEWIWPNTPSLKIQKLHARLGIDKRMAKILLNRGFDDKQIALMTSNMDQAIEPPTLITNAEKAADIIYNYCNNPNALIWIFADYDCDGITAGYIMYSALKDVSKCEIQIYYPNREEGYGLNKDFVKELVQNKSDKRTLVITVDNGIAQIEEIDYLMQNGIEVVVTDHHMSKERIPNCVIVDPHNMFEPQPAGQHLAGCGVAFKVAQIVQARFDVFEMLKYTPYVAIGTLADIMPLTIENVALIKYGLYVINSEKCPKGIKAFKDYLGRSTITANDIIWDIAPCINACGRMGDVSIAAELFFLDKHDPEDVVLAMQKLNDERKAYTDKAKKYISKLNFDNDNICIINADEFPDGILGIIASRAVETHCKPAIVIKKQENSNIYSGSARSIGDLDIQPILKNEWEKENIVGYGGHSAAAGLQIKEEKLEDFSKSIREQLKNFKIEVQTEENTKLIIDDIIHIDEIGEELYNVINEMPFDNKSLLGPVFVIPDVKILRWKMSGNNKNNICFTIQDGTRTMDLWAWGMADKYKDLGEPKKMHIAGQIERNFMKPKSYTLRVIDFVET